MKDGKYITWFGIGIIVIILIFWLIMAIKKDKSEITPATFIVGEQTAEPIDNDTGETPQFNVDKGK